MHFLINGPTTLSGEIEVNGAKNAALKIIPASILSCQKITITNLPNIQDIDKSLKLLVNLGGKIDRQKDCVEIETKNINQIELNKELADQFRASIMFVGPMLTRFKEVKFPHPGGCVIGAGSRPIDLFLDGFKKMGAEIIEKNNFYYLKAKKLKAFQYFFPNISVTATEALMMTAVLANGTTTLQNCAMEPEIKVLADYLNKQGAKIKGAGTPTIIIHGVSKINAGKFQIIPDRIETGSFAIMAAAAKSTITIKKCNPNHIQSLLNIFNKIEVPFEYGKDWLKIKSSKTLKPYNIKTHEYPGFPTDLQSPYTVLMTQACGQSLIHETIYDRRMLYADILVQMGANIITCDPHRIIVNGPTKLFGRKLTSPDLRAGISLIIAALIAHGKTEIDNIYQIDRGYENIEERLSKLGVDIIRVNKIL